MKGLAFECFAPEWTAVTEVSDGVASTGSDAGIGRNDVIGTRR